MYCGEKMLDDKRRHVLTHSKLNAATNLHIRWAIEKVVHTQTEYKKESEQSNIVYVNRITELEQELETLR
jgi:hypothetical protein